MPEEEVHHFITIKDLETIREGGRNYFLDVCLATFGAALGFIQNFITLIGNILAKEIPNPWTYWGSFFFIVFLVATICLYFASQKQRSPLAKLAGDIESRPLHDYKMTAGTQDGPRKIPKP